jgi:hypothetical protein
MRTTVQGALVFLSLSGLAIAGNTQQISSAPPLEKRGSTTQLIVDGRPFLILGGELHNSSSSNLEYMKPIWPRFAAMGLNTARAGASTRKASTRRKRPFTALIREVSAPNHGVKNGLKLY